MPRLSALALLLFAATPAGAAAPPNRDDAPLHAVQFADHREGWAAGDHGTVWHTIDAGATWERQVTPTNASLRSLQFLTPYIGWAVGRAEGAPGVGVVLGTEDGGATWAELSVGSTSPLNHVHFFDEKRGVAVGDGTPAFPSGLFATADGGRTWGMVPAPRAGSWLAAEWSGAGEALFAGAHGKLARLSNGALAPAESDPLQGAAVRAVRRAGDRAVAVGDRGQILTSDDAGRTWGFASLPVSEDAAGAWDFRTLAKAGTHLWAAGRPGSAVLHSPDLGRTWEVQKTGHPVPIRSLFMLDEQTGWAAGDLGTVLHTSNGGRSWSVQRCGGQKAAVLFAQSRPERLPLGVAAKLCGDEGYLGVGLVPSPDADENRVHAAMRSVGGAAGECGSAGDPTRRLVTALRTWRPDVVAGDPLASESPESRALLAATQDAFKQAADPAAFPELAELGLEPHAARKLYAQDAADAPGGVRYDLAKFSVALGDSPRDCAATAARLVGDSVAPDAFRLVSTRIDGAAGHADLMDGIPLAEGGTARRKRPAARPELAELLREREESARVADRLGGMLAGAPNAADALRLTANVAGDLAKLPDDLAARAAVGLGEQLARSGRWVQARELFSLAVTKYPGHPESVPALRWLVTYTASSEARRRHEAAPEWNVQQTSFTAVDANAPPEAKHDRSATKTAVPELAPGWARACLGYEPAARAHGPALARDPALLMAFLAAKRQAGLYGDAAESLKTTARLLGGFAHDAPGVDPWKDAVAAELWLGNPESVPARPKPLATAAGVTAGPALDGKLDDACWRTASPLPLSGGAGKAEAMFAHDSRCLYVAVRCAHPPRTPAPRHATRRHDMPLSDDDRVELLLDLDRDYQTAFRLQFDHRGAVADDCWGDAGWNPRWFVAVEATGTEWVAEVAIPWEELCGAPPTPGQVWAMNVTRFRAGQSPAAWSLPADGKPRPEGMGLLQFTAAK